MSITDPLIFPELADCGLNLQALFAIEELPASLLAELGVADVTNREAESTEPFTHVLLLGHAGTRLWDSLQKNLSLGAQAHPIDHYSKTLVEDFLCTNYPQVRAQWLYPQTESVSNDLPKPVNLQAFGKLAGWHGDSPFRLGVNPHWGSWYAYRALLLVSGLPGTLHLTAIATEARAEQQSVCTSCTDKPCIAACPAGALSANFIDYNLNACIDYRLQPDSPCSHQCLARSACPVGSEHQYSAEQMAYHYGVSLAMIQSWRLREN